jgi:hypothetical protein
MEVVTIRYVLGVRLHNPRPSTRRRASAESTSTAGRGTGRCPAGLLPTRGRRLVHRCAGRCQRGAHEAPMCELWRLCIYRRANQPPAAYGAAKHTPPHQEVRSRPTHWAGGGLLRTDVLGVGGAWPDRYGPTWISQGPKSSMEVVTIRYVLGVRLHHARAKHTENDVCRVHSRPGHGTVPCLPAADAWPTARA